MAKPEDAAKEFLKGLGGKPWDTPMGGGSAPRKAAPPKAESKGDDDPIGSQVEKIASRNREFAKRTRYLRSD